MKLIKVVVLTLLLQANVDAQENDPFAELDAEIQKQSPEGLLREREEFEIWKENYLAEYQQFRVEHFKQLDDIRDKLISTWGEAETSSESKVVIYDESGDSKTVLDYQSNEIVISILHEENEQVSPEKLSLAIQQASKQQSTGLDNSGSESKAPLEQFVGKPVDKSALNAMVNEAIQNTEVHKPIYNTDPEQAVKNEVENIKQQMDAQKKQVEIILDIVSKDESDVSSVKSETLIARQKQEIEKEQKDRINRLREQSKKFDNNDAQRAELAKKQITTFRIPLADRGDLQKAEPFIQEVIQQSKRWELQPSLLLSIIHTESYFNPQAKSHIPAYGLMQIVPRTASIDVNRFLFDKDEPMVEAYLYSPEHNIETGVAYVHILNSRYLKGIADPLSRMYCTIAAYNTGSGNVAKTFNKDKTRNLNNALKIINSLSPSEVYDKLIHDLPYEETRNYLNRVTNRKSIYLKIDSI
jgi:membrane-bound lytic murein transglycosylase C